MNKTKIQTIIVTGASSINIGTPLVNHALGGAIHELTLQLAAILHPSAYLFGDINGVPYARTRDEYLDMVKNRFNNRWVIVTKMLTNIID